MSLPCISGIFKFYVTSFDHNSSTRVNMHQTFSACMSELMFYECFISVQCHGPTHTVFIVKLLCLCVIWFSSGCTLCLGRSFSVSTTQKRRIAWRTCCRIRLLGLRCPSARVSEIFLHLPPFISCLWIHPLSFHKQRVTCLQPNWTPPLSFLTVLNTGRAQISAICSYLPFCVNM